MECFKQHPYLDSSDENNKQQGLLKVIPTTLSGAIEYVHIKIPLTKVLFDAHHLLDDIAKEKTGRDSIAIRVHKPSGKALEWSQPWQIALNKQGQLVINEIANHFRQEQAVDDQFSSNFFYKIRERFDVLNPVMDRYGNESHKAVLDHGEEEDIDFMCMEYLNSGATRLKTMQQAKQAISPLLEQCRRVTRNVKINNPDAWQRSPFLRVDGALLVRFLAQKGAE
jgi:CRISPR-associated protein Cmr2